jgi:hypothetical protein
VVTSIAIYVEGGGATGATRRPLRNGMSAFLEPIVSKVRERRIRWLLVVCGGRQQTFEAFCHALVEEPEVFNVLLVDSEAPIAITVPPWTHLRNRAGDRWTQPAGADDASCQLMVACMEAWFLADPAALHKHFGGKFNAKVLPPASQSESCTLAQINDAFKKATRATPAKEYQKIRDGAKLLEKIDPAEVRKHCKWCERLFKTLRDAMGGEA